MTTASPNEVTSIDLALSRLAAGSSRERLLAAAIQCTAASSADHVTAAEIIKAAGVSRPTLYSYFDDVSSVLAEAWVELGRPWLTSLLDGLRPSTPAELQVHATMTEILSIALRVPEVHEVVIPDLQSLWTELQALGKAKTAQMIWLMGIQIGMQLSAPIIPEILNLYAALPIIQSIPEDVEKRLNIGNAPVLATPIDVKSPYESTSSDDLNTALIRASVRVVSNSGVAAASLTRICRAARVTTGAAKPRFKDTNDLLLQGFDFAIQKVVEENLAEYDSVDMQNSPWDGYAQLVNTSLSESRLTWRRYRQELHLAAHVNPALAAHLAESFDRINAALRESLIALNLETPGVEASIQLNQSSTIGLSLLHDLGLPIETVDHRVTLRWIGEVLFPGLYKY
jgi:AcrR family transcriptional regulator